MAVTKLVQAPGSGSSPAPGVGAPTTDNTTVIVELGGSVDSIRQEIDDAFADMRTFLNREPDEIMRMTSAHSARLSELRVKAMRIEDMYRPAYNLRVRELEPAIDELERQWRNASRLHSVRELDWKIESGER